MLDMEKGRPASTQDGPNATTLTGYESIASVNEKLSLALKYIEAGWHIFPASVLGKNPDGRKNVRYYVSWKSESFNDEENARKWWHDGSPYGIGVDCGKSNIVVEDIDSLEALEWRKEQGDIGGIPTSITATGGLHLFYRADPEHPIRNSASRVHEKFDIRGNGGMIFLPGTTTGDYGIGFYEWAGGIPDLKNLPPVPEHVRSCYGPDGKTLKEPATTPRERVVSPSPAQSSSLFNGGGATSYDPNTHDLAWVLDTIREKDALLRDAVVGQNFNDRLNTLALTVGRAVPGAFSAEVAYAQLVRCVERTFPNGVDQSDIQTINSGLRAGMSNPWNVIRPESDDDGPKGLAAALSGEAVAGGLMLAPSNLPNEFWESRESLRLIRDVAHQRLSSADAVFGGVLARIAAALPPQCGPDTGIGGSTTSLNLIVSLVAPSGGGKSSGLKVVDAVMPEDERWNPHALPLGSGEGIAEAFMGVVSEPNEETGKPKQVRKKIYDNALLHKDEGAELVRMLERQGSTVSEALRSAWSGEVLGQQNGRADTTRIIPAGSYSLGMTIGFQPGIAGRLFTPEQVELGTVQRFLWLSAVDATIPDETEEYTTARLKLPGVPGEEWGDSSLFPGGQSAGKLPKMTIADTIKARLRAERLAKQRGTLTVERLDSHKPLLLVKLSCLLAVLDGRTDATEDDWSLAEQVLAVSGAVRLRIQQASAREQERENIARLRRREQEAAASERGRKQEEQACIGGHIELIARKLREAGQPQTRRKIRDWIYTKHRACIEEALGQGVAAGVLSESGGLYAA